MEAQAGPAIAFVAIGSDAAFVAEQLLGGDHVIADARDLGDRHDTATTIAEARDLHDEVERAGDLPPQALGTALETGESHQHLDAVKAFAG